MAIDAQTVARWPGKTIQGQYHPALWHMLDVGAVAAEILRHRPLCDREDWREALVLLICLHDLGKISSAFQTQITTGMRSAFHTDLGNILLSETLFPALHQRLAAQPRALKELLAATTGHHGGPPGLYDRREQLRLTSAIGETASKDAAHILDGVARLFPQASLEGLDGRTAKALSWALAGLTVQADWIGSNADWFPVKSPLIPVPDYWAEAKSAAETAVKFAGLFTAHPRTGPRFLSPDQPLRPMQQAVQDVTLSDGPTLALIEDTTGAGKTEAALILAARMIRGGAAHGVFFALPTMATSNAMLARMEPATQALFEGRPSLGLSHGRSGQNALFREIQSRDGSDPAEPVTCGAWLADDRRKILLADVGVGTVDQALLGVLPTRFNTLRLWALSQKVLIVDEAHSYDPYMETELRRLLRFQAAMGGSAIVMTATLPLAMRQGYADAFRAGLGLGPMPVAATGYPCLTMVSSEVDSCQPAPAATSVREVRVTRVSSEGEVIGRIKSSAQKGASCLWVRNAVDDAIAAVDQLRGQGIAADLLHARFTTHDRLVREQAMLAKYGKHRIGGAGGVLVATQVVEASLDLDFDLMVSDLAPIGALIQRAGRLWRHMDLRPASSRPLAVPELVVLSPDPAQVTSSRWVHQVLDGGAWVYPQDVQWRTARAVFNAGALRSPQGLRPLIEAVHGIDAPPVPAALESAEDETLGRTFGERAQAQGLLLEPDKGYLKAAQRIFDEERLSTRLGIPQVTLRLAQRNDCGLEPMYGSWTSSELQLSRARFERAGGVNQDAPEVVAAKAGWRDWEKDSIVLAVPGADGRISDGLMYDPERGLLIES